MHPLKNVFGSKNTVEIDLAVKFSTLVLTLRPLRGFHISKAGKQQMNFKAMARRPYSEEWKPLQNPVFQVSHSFVNSTIRTLHITDE